MTDLNTYELSNIDPDDISDVLIKIEKSFEFKFDEIGLVGINTFGEFCDVVINKVQGNNSDDCTTQQAFYKVRKAILTTLCIDKYSITPDSRLQELFPKHRRRRQIATVDEALGFKTKILRPKHWVTAAFVLTLITSFIGLFIFWEIALSLLVISIIGFKVSNKLGNELDLQTVRQLTEKISREQYKQVRRANNTVNRNEIVLKIRELFMYDLDLEESALTREAKFG